MAMTAKDRRHSTPRRLLRKERAAAYCDISEPIFDGLVKAGIFPQPRQVTPGIFAWDVFSLHAAIDALPTRGGAAQDDTWSD